MNPWTFGAQTAPDSQVVQSDDEFLSPFRTAVSNAEQRAGDTIYDQSNAARKLGVSMAEFQGHYNPGAVGDYYYQKLMGARDGTDSMADMFNNYSRATGYDGLTPYQIQHYDAAGAQAKAQAQLGGATGALEGAQGERRDNSQRQHDAFGQMQGGNFFGGMMNEGYSAPNAGQVGARPGGLGGLGGMPTVAPQESGFGDYRATFNPGAQQHRAGAWGGGW